MWNYLQKTDRPIVLWGTGNGADKIIEELAKRNMPIAGVFASNGFVRNRTFHDFPVLSYEEAKRRFPDMIILLCFGTHLPEVISMIQDIECKEELYAPDVPIAGDGLFTPEYELLHKDQIESVFHSLSDEKSRQVYLDCLSYKRSGKLSYLRDCETPDSENWKLLKIGPAETFVDLGAYDGDTISQFLSYTDSYTHIYGVEPDQRNFRKLTEHVEHLPNTTLMQMAISDHEEALPFSKGRGRGGGIGKGTYYVDAKTIDTLFNDVSITLLKMDLEGQEPLAIAGAKEVISKQKPKMLISAYHRMDDLWTIPEAVLRIRPDYHVYLRKSPCIPSWEINYYFV